MKKILIILCILVSLIAHGQSQKNQFQILRDSLIINHSSILKEDGYLVYKKSNIIVQEVEIIEVDALENTVYKSRIVCSISDKFVELNEYQEKTLYDLLKNKEYEFKME
jgi:hypothetical protein